MKRWLLVRLLRNRHALRRERRYSRALEAQLEGEKYRNRAREDELITVPMRMQGMYGVATREGPARPIEPLRRQVQRKRSIPSVDGWAMLTDEERAEYQMYRADINPLPEQETSVKREFLEMVRLRRMANEEIM